MGAIIGLIISAIAGAYSAKSSSDAAKAQAKQTRYNAEANADAAEKAAKQERLNRDAQRRLESRALKRQRARIEAAYAKSGVGMEGTPEMVLAEQTAADEEWLQNQERISIARGLGLDVQSENIRRQSKSLSSALNKKARTTLIAGSAGAIGGAISGYRGSISTGSSPQDSGSVQTASSPRNNSENWIMS